MPASGGTLSKRPQFQKEQAGSVDFMLRSSAARKFKMSRWEATSEKSLSKAIDFLLALKKDTFGSGTRPHRNKYIVKELNTVWVWGANLLDPICDLLFTKYCMPVNGEQTRSCVVTFCFTLKYTTHGEKMEPQVSEDVHSIDWGKKRSQTWHKIKTQYKWPLSGFKKHLKKSRKKKGWWSVIVTKKYWIITINPKVYTKCHEEEFI